MSYLLRAPGRHRCNCGWEGKPKDAVKAGKPVSKCPKCSEVTALIPLREIPGYCFCCASASGKLQIIDHTMIRECRQCGARLNLHTVEPWIWEVQDMEQAVNKVKAEMDQAKDNPTIQGIGKYLLQLLEVNPAAAEKVITEGKNISNAAAAAKSAFQKRAVNGMAMIEDEEVYKEVRKYFGIQGKAVPASAVPVPAAAVVPPAPLAPPLSVGLDISDLFGDL